MDAIHSHMSYLEKKATFFNAVNPIIDDLMKHRLDFCKLKTLPPTKWLAEHDLGFSRILPYIYHHFIEICPSQPAFRELQQLSNSLHVMLSLLMSDSDVNVVVLENHIKVFLDSCHHFCNATHDNTYREFWLAKANFISLLNLPKQIDRLGKLRWYWEGNRERFIQTIKSQVQALRQKYSYYESKLLFITRLNTFRWIDQDLFDYDKEKKTVTTTSSIFTKISKIY